MPAVLNDARPEPPVEGVVLPRSRPDDAVTCPQCSGRGFYGSPGVTCGFCGGRGWSELLTDWHRLNRPNDASSNGALIVPPRPSEGEPKTVAPERTVGQGG